MYFNEKEFSKRIAALRTGKGFSQYRLAEELNISRVYLATIEGAKKTPSLDLMIEIADYFQVSLDYLILGKTDRPDRSECRTAVRKALRILNELDAMYGDDGVIC